MAMSRRIHIVSIQCRRGRSGPFSTARSSTMEPREMNKRDIPMPVIRTYDTVRYSKLSMGGEPNVGFQAMGNGPRNGPQT